MVAGGEGNWTMPPPNCPKGGGQHVFWPPPTLHGPFHDKADFCLFDRLQFGKASIWAQRVKNANPSKLAQDSTLFDPCQEQRVWYAPSKAKERPSLTLAEPCQAWYRLSLEKNGHLKHELGPFKLKRDTLMLEMDSLIPHIGPLRPVAGSSQILNTRMGSLPEWGCVLCD